MKLFHVGGVFEQGAEVALPEMSAARRPQGIFEWAADVLGVDRRFGSGGGDDDPVGAEPAARLNAKTSESLPETSDSADEGFQHGGAVEGPEPQVVSTGWFLQGGHPVQGGP